MNPVAWTTLNLDQSGKAKSGVLILDRSDAANAFSAASSSLDGASTSAPEPIWDGCKKAPSFPAKKTSLMPRA